MGCLSNPRKQGNEAISEREVTYTHYRGNSLCEPNLVSSRFSSVNPEFISVSSPVLKRKRCLNTVFVHSHCNIAFLAEYFSYFKYKYLKIINLHFIYEKLSILSLVSWGIFLLCAFDMKQVKLSAIG